MIAVVTLDTCAPRHDVLNLHGARCAAPALCRVQNIDLYSRSNNLMKDSLELHAELILKFPAKLPPGWADVQKMVKPPPGPDGKPLVWKFDMATQTWYAQDVKGRKLIPLLDGVKYLVGVGFLPFGWEVRRCGREPQGLRQGSDQQHNHWVDHDCTCCIRSCSWICCGSHRIVFCWLSRLDTFFL